MRLTIALCICAGALAAFAAVTRAATPATAAKGVSVREFRGWRDSLVLEASGVHAVVAPAVGGRILQYGVAGENIIYENPLSFGKTLGNSPDGFSVGGYQCDIGVMDGKSIWGSLYDESRRKKFLVQGDHDKITAKFKPDDWNILVVRCEGPRIRIWVNDVATVDYTETEPNISKTGIIGLQIHGGAPAVASYRHLRIRELR